MVLPLGLMLSFANPGFALTEFAQEMKVFKTLEGRFEKTWKNPPKIDSTQAIMVNS